jgi:hypothetical protein
MTSIREINTFTTIHHPCSIETSINDSRFIAVGTYKVVSSICNDIERIGGIEIYEYVKDQEKV